MINLKNQAEFLISIYNKEPYKGAGIDINHAMLLFGIILSQKPEKILELGIGSGVASETILNALKYNSIKYIYDAVDNLCDIGGNLSEKYITKLKNENVNIFISEEEKFVKNCEPNKYDLIISDADHFHAGDWVEDIFRICKHNGIILCHDVDKGYPNLTKYVDYVKRI